MAEGRKRVFKKFKYRGIDLDQLVDLTIAQKMTELLDIMPCRIRRKFNRKEKGAGLKPQHMEYLAKLRKAKKNCKEVEGIVEKPKTVRTHLRNMVILPEMIGSVCGVYTGKHYVTVEIKPQMVGRYLGEFSITYKPVKHGRPGIGATNSSRFIPLK